jgi:ribosome hibernation promoting factor
VQINLTARHLDLPQDVKEYAQEKCQKLLKFYDRIQAIDVVVDAEGDQFSVEILVSAAAHHEFIAKDVGPDTFALIDANVDKLERQLTKHKQMQRNHKHPTN